ncbi:MAG: SDR family NAD(P)-dependent oxidoreductase [Candidatus Rokubacteria bacterium]|nr:SDR family NAD(P)-dependent oxidoreductase [Candidatus Rokubacteria bacterium]
MTGASRGFGRAIALAFAREGARVAANDLASRREADEVVAEAGRFGAEAIALCPGPSCATTGSRSRSGRRGAAAGSGGAAAGWQGQHREKD